MSADRTMIAKVADLYYLRHLTQQEIADRLGVSRPTVSRLLRRSRAEGIVKIEVTLPDGHRHELERNLEDRFRLREAVVIRGRPESPTLTRRALGEAAAAHLDRLLAGGERVGISWGTTLASVVDHVRPRRVRTAVIPLVGGLGQAAPGIHANELARRLAEAHQGTAHLLHAPAIVATSGVRTALLTDPGIRRVLDLACRVDIALVGVGALVPSSTLIHSGYLSAQELAALRRRGAVGDICTRSFTAEGARIGGTLDARIMAVDLDDLRRIRTVIGVAGGLEKAEAILGALRGGLVTVLVTDHLAAQAVLRARPTRPAGRRVEQEARG
ncbi:MAG TPA: sugar-binding transcriptional regulator [bacterium]|nr:sugar-binding transcriptional regulator [bacterium]